MWTVPEVSKGLNHQGGSAKVAATPPPKAKVRAATLCFLWSEVTAMTGDSAPLMLFIITVSRAFQLCLSSRDWTGTPCPEAPTRPCIRKTARCPLLVEEAHNGASLQGASEKVVPSSGLPATGLRDCSLIRCLGRRLLSCAQAVQPPMTFLVAFPHITLFSTHTVQGAKGL